MGWWDPFGDAHVVPPAHWLAEPNVRGTWTILSSCLITLTLALWASLHLNLPRHGHENQTWRKIRWVLLGLLAPEVLAYTAWTQRRAAWQLTTQIRALLGQGPELTTWLRLRRWVRLAALKILKSERKPLKRDTPIERPQAPSGSRRRHEWTTTHSFLAVMGGFAFDTARAEPSFLPGDRTRLAIWPKGLLSICERAPDLLPDVHVDDIRDKAKADSFAKTLVCLQTAWFCIQFLVRLAQHQTVALLELNVFAHAICALLVCAIWWHKPLDVAQPFLLTGEEAWEVCALFCMTGSHLPTWSLWAHPFSPAAVNPVYAYMCNEWATGHRFGAAMPFTWLLVRLGWQHRDFNTWCQAVNLVLKLDQASCSPAPADFSSSDSGEFLVKQDVRLFGFSCHLYRRCAIDPTLATDKGGPLLDQVSRCHCRHCSATLAMLERDDALAADAAASDPDHGASFDGGLRVKITSTDSRRFRLFRQALIKYDMVDVLTQALNDPPTIPFASLHPESPFVPSIGDRISNRPSSYYLTFDGSWASENAFPIAYSLASFAYGALHLIAWDCPFPWTAQTILWRASGCAIMASSFLPWFVQLSARIESVMTSAEAVYKLDQKTLFNAFAGILRATRILLRYSSGILAVAALLSYILARVYIVVASFVQLSRLPESATTQVDWSRYFPHVN